MLQRLIIDNPNRLPVKYWSKYRFLRNSIGIEFSPGVNVIFGPSDTGKKQLLELLSVLTLTWDKGYSEITSIGVRKLSGFRKRGTQSGYESRPVILDGARIISDGQKCYYLNNTTNSYIYGYTSNHELSNSKRNAERCKEIIKRAVESDGIVKDTISTYSYLEKPLIEYKNFVTKSILPKTQQTVLLYNPTNEMDIDTEIAFWAATKILSKDIQFIIATNSIVSLSLLKSARFIETKKNYLKKCFDNITLSIKEPAWDSNQFNPDLKQESQKVKTKV